MRKHAETGPKEEHKDWTHKRTI